MGTFRWRLLVEHQIGWFQIGLLLVLLILFAWNAGTPVLHIWDEARLAVNAAEMLRSGDWLITRYNGQPDLWNTKPPLLIWLQAASLYLLGYNMWAIRLPSILAALATAWLIYRFGRYTLDSRFAGTFAALILATSPGFNGTHVARFGDYDALLALCLTATALSWYQYSQRRHTRQLWLGTFWFALALLTKSAAALLLLPAVAVYLLAQPAGRWVFWQGRTYTALAVACGPLVLFYGLREAAEPGYLAATWFNDWYGRLSQHIVTVNYPWWIYFQRLLFPGLLTWIPLLPMGIWLGTLAQPAAAPKHRFAQFASVFVLVFIVLISVARTRLTWYSAPVYPMAALLCALGLEHLIRQALTQWRWPRKVIGSVLVLALVLPAGVLLHHEWARWETEQTDSTLHYGYQLPQLIRIHPQLGPFTILREKRHNAVLDFYVASLREQGVQPVTITTFDSTAQQLHPHQQLLICAEPIHRYVRQHYYTQPLASVAPCAFIEILGCK